MGDICPEHSECNNTDGSYYCKCDTGYSKTAEGKCRGIRMFILINDHLPSCSHVHAIKTPYTLLLYCPIGMYSGVDCFFFCFFCSKIYT